MRGMQKVEEDVWSGVQVCVVRIYEVVSVGNFDAQTLVCCRLNVRAVEEKPCHGTKLRVDQALEKQPRDGWTQ